MEIKLNKLRNSKPPDFFFFTINSNKNTINSNKKKSISSEIKIYHILAENADVYVPVQRCIKRKGNKKELIINKDIYL